MEAKFDCAQQVCQLEQAGPHALHAPPLQQQQQLEAGNATTPLSEAHGAAAGSLQGSSSAPSAPEAGAKNTVGTSCTGSLHAAAEPQPTAVTVGGGATGRSHEAWQAALTLGPGATALLVCLGKEDASTVWDTLQAPAVVAAAKPSRPPTDLATLR